MRKKPKRFKKHQKIYLAVLILILLPTLSFISFLLIFKGKIYPGVSVAGIPLEGLTPSNASQILSQNSLLPKKIILVQNNQTYSLPTSSFNATVDNTTSAQNAYNIGRSQNFWKGLPAILEILTKTHNLPLKVSIDEKKLTDQIKAISETFSNPPKEPAFSIINDSIYISKGSPGLEVNTKELIKTIHSNLSVLNTSPITIPVTQVDPTLTVSETQKAKKRAEKLLNKTLTLKHKDQIFIYKDKDIIPLLNPKHGYKEKLINKISTEIAKAIDRPPQDPLLVFSNNRVQEFAPALDGIKTNITKLETVITNSIFQLEDRNITKIEANIPTTLTPPELKTEDVNNLGIKELIGKGESYFKGSIASRIHNIALAASRINGTLIKPGETFSFNSAVGDISKNTGFKEAYIIKDGKTILGDGGGVCQVSTTLFRAALNSGLPIVERRAHAYRVGYYEQDSPPGLDATVYSPTTDLKFKNDTPGYILIQAHTDTQRSKLTLSLYGTSDGRTSSITKPIITEQTPPPDDMYQDDPSLPQGTTKQVDYKAWGAKVYFKYKVSRAGETIYEKTFHSTYRPWAAVFLVGTAPIQ